jgi:hypothetical protein
MLFRVADMPGIDQIVLKPVVLMSDKGDEV